MNEADKIKTQNRTKITTEESHKGTAPPPHPFQDYRKGK